MDTVDNAILDEIFDLLDGAKRYERYIVARCPFHEDTRPSFFVYPDRYRCAACEAWGKTKNLLERLGKFQPPSIHIHQEKSSPFQKWIGQYGNLPKILTTAHRNCKKVPSFYLRKRGITNDYQIELGLGILENWLLFPIKDQYNNIIGAVARAGEGNKSTSKYIIPAGQDPNLLYVPSWTRIRNPKRDYIYITFGIIDAISLYQLGLASCSTTTGKHISPETFSGIRKRIIFVPDFGEEKEAIKIASQLGWRGGILRLNYPSGCKDPNDVFLKNKNLLLETIR